MKNKIMLKKTIIAGLIVFVVIGVIFGTFSYIEYRKYTMVFNKKVDNIIGMIKENYPESNINEIVEILNNESLEKTNILSKYGIDIIKDSVVFENDIYFRKYLILDITIFFMLFILLSFIFLNYNRKKDKKLKEITEYIEQINRKNYKLDIEDNTEDELSILKNEVYKTTIMLKEVSENSLEDKVKLKDSLADISHQLKTPLTSITIMLDNMLDNRNMEHETREEFIKDIKREVTNINFLVSSLLKLSKFDANIINFMNKEEYIGEILKEAVKNVEGLCDLKNVAIDIDGNNVDSIICDFKWQVEAITNIIKNCVEHSHDNSKIDIRYSKNKMYARIDIKDYGIGISKKDLPHIFERFYKGVNSSGDSVRYWSCTC